MNIKKKTLKGRQENWNKAIWQKLGEFSMTTTTGIQQTRGNMIQDEFQQIVRRQITEDFANQIKEFKFYNKYEGKPLEDYKKMNEMF